MRLAMLTATVVAVVFAIFAFLLVEVAANAYINKSYLSSESRTEREMEYVSELQAYVDRNELSSLDVAKLAEWAQSNKYLYVMIHKDDKLLFETGRYEEPDEDKNETTDDGKGENQPDDGAGTPDDGTGTPDDGTGTPDDGTGTPDDGTGAPDDGTGTPDDGTGTPDDGEGTPDGETTPDTENGEGGTEGGEPNDKDDKDDSIGSGITITMPTREELMKYAEEKEAHLITMSDGPILVSMAEFTEYLYYDITNIAAMVLAVIVLVLTVLLYSHGVTRRITKIAADVSLVAEGDMDHSIRPDGQDELGRLSRDVENMRSAMLENVAKEREAMDANAELVTSMSHDIRTPLTVLLGYLNVMRLHSPDEEMTSYINASEKTALRLKKLSDDMFNYFLLFGGGAAEVDMQEYDAYTLLDQMLSEHVLLLREQGYEVELDIGTMAAMSIKVSTDANLLKRIIENVFSNVLKYANKEQAVILSGKVEGDKLWLSLKNTVAETDGVESNHIGLKTCHKLASLIGASFSAEQVDNVFITAITLNVVMSEENKD